VQHFARFFDVADGGGGMSVQMRTDGVGWLSPVIIIIILFAQMIRNYIFI